MKKPDYKMFMLLRKNRTEILNTHLAGFGHAEGYIVLSQMKVGDLLYMVREDENKYDHNAIALFYVPEQMPEGAKMCIKIGGVEKEAVHVGYIPMDENTMLSTMLDMGWENIYECRITQINPLAHPNQQVHIRVDVKRNTHNQ